MVLGILRARSLHSEPDISKKPPSEQALPGGEYRVRWQGRGEEDAVAEGPVMGLAETTEGLCGQDALSVVRTADLAGLRGSGRGRDEDCLAAVWDKARAWEDGDESC